MKNRFNEYDEVKKDFQRFFNEKLLSLELANKADINEIYSINLKKASIQDLKQL